MADKNETGVAEKPMRGSAPNDLRRASRIACWGGVADVVIAYVFLIPMKWHGLLPAGMTWSRVVLGPVFMTALVPLLIFTEGKTKKTLLWFSILILLAIALILLDPAPACD
jgi:hypothetical protein